MSLLLPSRKPATLLAIATVSIHGAGFVDAVFILDEEPDQQRAARLGSMDVEAGLEPGARVLVHFVMGVATSVKRAK
jgi:hypothetical protein